MKPIRLWAIARKEAIHIWRDPRSLAVAIAIPMLMLILFGYALTLDVDRVPLMVWDQSNSPSSRELISRFTGSRYFALYGYGHSYAELQHGIDSGQILVALVVPRHFAQQLDAGRNAQIQVIADGSDANTATLALGYADMATAAFSQQVTVEQFQRAGLTAPQAPLESRPRVWFNTDMESRNFIIPGLIAVIMMVIAALLTSLTVAREWERGTMEQLIATPVKGAELVIGKLIPYFGLGMLDMIIAVAMGEFLFHVPLRGSLVLMFGMASVFLIGVLSMGMLFSIVTRTQLLASQMAMVLTFLPAFLLSGFAFAIANMPRTLQYITYIVPARYFVSALKAIYLKGVGVDVLIHQGMFLVGFAVLMLALCNLKFKKKLV